MFADKPMEVFEEAKKMKKDKFSEKYFMIWSANKYQKVGMYKEAHVIMNKIKDLIKWYDKIDDELILYLEFVLVYNKVLMK